MKEDIEEAVTYANHSNRLENNRLTVPELEKIIDDIKTGKSDESFIYSVVKLVKEHEEARERGTKEDHGTLRR